MTDAELNQRIAEIVSSVVAEAFSKQTASMQLELMSKLNEIKSGQDLANSKLAHIGAMVDAHEVAIRGNGKPGILAELSRISPLVMEHQETLRGTNEATGLVGRVSNLEGKTENISKPLWVVAAAFLGSAVSLLVQHFTK